MSKTNKVLRIGLIVGVLASTALPAAAQNVNDPKIQEREIKQQERIQQGVNSGQLTQRGPGAWRTSSPASRPPKTA